MKNPQKVILKVFMVMVALIVTLSAPLAVSKADAMEALQTTAPVDGHGGELLASGWWDNFDSYPPVSSLHGQGGWKGWGNDPAATAFTSSYVTLTAPNSVKIIGAADLVHEYFNWTSGAWIYKAWQYIPTDFSGESYFIILNQYDDAGTTLNWSVQVSFDSTTNLVENTGTHGGSLPLIKGQWIELRVEIDLTNDAQEFYYNDQLLYEGTWSQEVSGGGIVNIAAVDLYANGASPVYYDDLSLTVKPVMIYLPVIIK